MAANFFSVITQSRQECNIAFKIQGKLLTQGKTFQKMKVKQRATLLRQWSFLGDTEVKNLSAMREPRVQCIGQENPLEKGMATHLNIMPGEFHGQRNPVGYSPWGRKELNTTKQLTLSLFHLLGIK